MSTGSEAHRSSRAPLQVRPASDADFLAFAGIDPPAAWIAEIAWRGDVPVAMGSVVWDCLGEDGGRAWAFFDAHEPVPASVMHRTAKYVIGDLRRARECALYTACNPNVPGADRWLARLGFKPSGEEVGGHGVWVLT